MSRFDVRIGKSVHGAKTVVVANIGHVCLEFAINPEY